MKDIILLSHNLCADAIEDKFIANRTREHLRRALTVHASSGSMRITSAAAPVTFFSNQFIFQYPTLVHHQHIARLQAIDDL
jgi:hypothetical protein